MKKKLLEKMAITFVVMLLMVSCNLLPFGGKVKVLGVADAKVEIRAANQEIIAHKDVMLEVPAMYSLSFMFELMTGTELKSASLDAPIYSRVMTYSKALNLFRGEKSLKSANLDDDLSFYGIFEYDFDYGSFEMVEESDQVLQFSFPADETALANQMNNAQISISNLKFDEINSFFEEYNDVTWEYEMVETTEPIPVSADVVMTVDGLEVLSAGYSASYNSEGMPLSMSAQMESDEYSFSMSYSGSGSSYSTKLEYKLGKEEIMAYEIDVVYASDMETVKSVDGFYLISPLKFEGSIDVEAMEGAGYDADDSYVEPTIEEMNAFIDIKVIQSEMNAQIGILEYRMYEDTDWGESYAMLAIVYEDGSYDWIDEVLTVMDVDVAL